MVKVPEGRKQHTKEALKICRGTLRLNIDQCVSIENEGQEKSNQKAGRTISLLTRDQEEFIFPSAKPERPLNTQDTEKNFQKRDQVILRLEAVPKPPNKVLKAGHKTIHISQRAGHD